MRPNGRNRNTNPNRNRDYIEEADQNTQRDYQNYGSEYDESDSGLEQGGGRYGSGPGRSQSQEHPSNGYYNRYDEPRRGSSNADQGYRSGRGGQQEFDRDYGRGSYGSQSGSSGRDNHSYGSGGMGYGDAEEQGRYGYRSGGQQSEGQGRHFGKGPKGYQRSDERIKEDVNEALSRHWDVDASDIEVQVQNGEVTLTGSVDSREAKRYAEDAAERAFGVKDVENKLKVKKDSRVGGSQSWSSESDSTSSSGNLGSKPGESTSMGEARRGAGSPSGSRS